MVFFVLLAVVSLLLLFFPLIAVGLSDGSTRIWLFSANFLGLAFVVLLLLVTLWGWNFSHRVRQFIHVVFGFKDSDNLLNFGLLLPLVCIVMSIGSTVKVTDLVTSSLSTTLPYSLVLICLFILLVMVLVALFQESRLSSSTQFMNIISGEEQESEASSTVQALFDEDDLSD